MARKELEASDVTAICDTKEQAPLDLLLPTIKASLYTGDYSVRGLEKTICVERKSLADLVGCCGQYRERFDKCIERMRGYETRVLVIESSWGAIELGQWRSQLKPTQVKAALFSWMRHVSVVVAGDRTNAAVIISGILFSSARNRWRELQGFIPELKIVSAADEAKEKGFNAQ